ncbi:MAG: hypothetical protein WBM98_13830, partial [Maribacter sp.]|uniref:hypothetical protein n=1 Tax=Maribacter sp. TaxID=1897614 RepID=UPI003C70D6EC
LKTNFDAFGIPNYNAALFTSQDVKLTRWGGEFKANIGTNNLKPYITLGTGVQSLELDSSDKLEQIYGSVGLGIKLNISPRAVFSLEAKNTTYNFNAGGSLLSEENQAVLAVTDADFGRNRLYNWGIQGSLEFYLGGRRPGTLTTLDQAYLDKFKGGFRGLQLIVEPSLGYIGFNDNSLYRDTYLLGGYAGIDFNEYIGIRGFYFQATQNEEISTDFDQLAMYGVELRARLNDGNGVTPFLILGGGYLNAYSDYLGKDDVTVGSGEFATGGLGLNIPLGKRLLISGGVRAMLTSGEDITDVNATDDLQNHLMYNLGLKLSIGKESVSTDDVYRANVDRELDAQQAINNTKLEQIELDYQNQVRSLEEELQKAYVAKDVDKAIEILEEKKEVEKALKEVDKLKEVGKSEEIKSVKQKEPVQAQVEAATLKAPEKSELIRMTPAEFESLIERILNGLDETPEPKASYEMPQQQMAPQLQQQQMDQLNKRIVLLEKLLLEANATKGTGSYDEPQLQQNENENDRVSVMSDRIMDKLNDLSKKIDRNTARIADNDNKEQIVVVTPSSESKDDTVIPNLNDQGGIMERENVSDGVKMLQYRNASGILGFNYGGASTANIGFRLHYDINKTPLQFMPEAYIGFGEGTSYGISGNVVFPFAINTDKVNPYVGAGLGFGSIADDTKGFYNIIIGSELPFLHKNVYVDYTMRNSFDYNQIAVGYKFSF